ncbi:MAG: hypothetical protein KGS10_18870 [Chloroflexi bacterium]|jgi:hypothetical protein|nr:hypothetical protein [Chloroflexota bacterium]
MDRFTRWTLVAVTVTVAVAIWTAVRAAPVFTPPGDDSPAAVARAWMTALGDGRAEDAWELLAPEAQSRETRAEFLRRHPSIVPGGPGAPRFRVDDASITENEARVAVTRSFGASSDFPFWRTTVASDRVTIRLRLVDGRWRVTSAPELP